MIVLQYRTLCVVVYIHSYLVHLLVLGSSDRFHRKDNDSTVV